MALKDISLPHFNPHITFRNYLSSTRITHKHFKRDRKKKKKKGEEDSKKVSFKRGIVPKK